MLPEHVLRLEGGATARSPHADAAPPAPPVSRDLLRREKELEAGIAKLLADREAAEKEAEAAPRGSGFCVRPFGVDVVGISQTVALVGALVGGIAARQRKIELEEVNEKLRAINISLRKQARAGVTYAPGLNYAPSAAGAAGAAGAAPVRVCLVLTSHLFPLLFTSPVFSRLRAPRRARRGARCGRGAPR